MKEGKPHRRLWQKGHRWRVGFGKLTIKSKDDRSFFFHDPNSLRVASWSIAFPRSIAKPSPKSYLSEFVSVHVADDLGPEKSTFLQPFAVFSRRAEWRHTYAQRGNLLKNPGRRNRSSCSHIFHR